MLSLSNVLNEKRKGQLFLVIAVIILPLILPWGTSTEIIIYSVVAMAANLLVGYGGLYSFGQAAFLGVGGYTVGNLLIHTQLPLPLVLCAAMLVCALFGAVMGWICVRRAGIYFIMLTFACNQALYYLAYQWTEVTNGPNGLLGIPRSSLIVSLSGDLTFYVFTAILFFLSYGVLQRLVDSPFGWQIVAMRENNRRATSIGCNVRRAHIVIFSVSAAFTGLAGGLYAMLYGLMPIDAIHWLNSGMIIFMVLIGGTRNLFGPVIGVIIFIVLQDQLSTYWNRWPLIFGGLIVLVVMFFQGGVLQVLDRYRAVLQRRSTGTTKHEEIS